MLVDADQVDTAPRRAPHVAERNVDDELVLYDPIRERVHVLNPTAAWVWRLCDGTHSPAAIAAELARIYPDARSAIEADVPDILRRFEAEALLEA